MVLLIDGQCGPDLLDTAQQTEESQHAIDERLEGSERRANIHHHCPGTIGTVDHWIYAGGGRYIRYERPIKAVRSNVDLRLRISVPRTDAIRPALGLIEGILIGWSGNLTAWLRRTTAGTGLRRNMARQRKASGRQNWQEAKGAFHVQAWIAD